MFTAMPTSDMSLATASIAVDPLDEVRLLGIADQL
jgi:hypothetical protein